MESLPSNAFDEPENPDDRRAVPERIELDRYPLEVLEAALKILLPPLGSKSASRSRDEPRPKG